MDKLKYLLESWTQYVLISSRQEPNGEGLDAVPELKSVYRKLQERDLPDLKNMVEDLRPPQ